MGTKSKVTEYTGICFFCGRPAEGEHHLLFGNGMRELCEEDGLKIPICNNCHNMGNMSGRIHGNVMAEKFSKMLGQALWEKEWLLKDMFDDSLDKESRTQEKRSARNEFRIRYGKSYL